MFQLHPYPDTLLIQQALCLSPFLSTVKYREICVTIFKNMLMVSISSHFRSYTKSSVVCFHVIGRERKIREKSGVRVNGVTENTGIGYIKRKLE